MATATSCGPATRRLSARVKNSQAYLNKVGRWRGGRIPYGYRPVTVEGKPGKYLEADPTTVPVVWDIVARIKAGDSLFEVAAYLTGQGIPTPLDRARQLMDKPRLCRCGHGEHDEPCAKHHKCLHRTAGVGGKKLHEYDECSVPCPEYRPREWSHDSLSVVLHNPNLLGHTIEGGRNRVLLDDAGNPVAFAPGLVRQEDWDAVQARLDERSRKKVRTSTSSLLLNIVTCDCGTPLSKSIVDSGGRKRTYEYYRERSGFGCRKNLGIICSVLDTLVSDKLLETLGHLETLKKQPPSAHRAELNAELKTVNAQLVQLFKERLEGERLRDNHQEISDQLEKRRSELKEQLDSEDVPETAWVPADVLFREKWESMAVKERRMWLLDAGVRVVAVRGRRPAMDFLSLPPRKRSMIVAKDDDVWAYIYLGNLGEMLRRAERSLASLSLSRRRDVDAVDTQMARPPRRVAGPYAAQSRFNSSCRRSSRPVQVVLDLVGQLQREERLRVRSWLQIVHRIYRFCHCLDCLPFLAVSDHAEVGRPAYSQQVRDLDGGHLTGVAELPGHAALLVGVGLRPTAHVATGTDRYEPGLRPLDDQGPLELRDRRQDREDQLADRRRGAHGLV
jgi:hypothetical protein